MSFEFNNLKISFLSSDKDFQKNVFFFIENWFSTEKTMEVQTSGSTGTPKIFDIEKEKMLHSAKMTCDFLGLKENHTALLCLPLEYISGKMMMTRALHRKLKLYATEPNLNPLQKLDFIVDFCAMTPLQVENSLDKIHYIQKLIIGGAAVSKSLKNKIKNQFLLKNKENNHNIKNVIYETYGMSETLSHIALRQIFPKEEPFFTVLSGVEISQDERNCLKISVPHLGIKDLQTNDIVQCFSRNSFQFLGRADNIINSGGVKIIPEQIENILKQHIYNELIIVGIPDEILGQKLVLIIEGERDIDIETKIYNIQFEKSFYRPKAIFFVKKIPRTPNNKVDRRAILNEICESFCK